MIAPAPMKPMPDAIWAATRMGSTFGPRWMSEKPYAPAIVNTAAPAATSACVRIPARWLRDSRSSPMSAPRPPAAATRTNTCAVSMIGDHRR
jgi:hypothetical protein